MNRRRGGTYVVSNLGMFGIEQVTAIINPPEAAIRRWQLMPRRVRQVLYPGLSRLPGTMPRIISTGGSNCSLALCRREAFTSALAV